MGIDDIKKEKKLEPIKDINELMNKFLNKVSGVVSASDFVDKKDLLEIRDILIDLKSVDKTITYALFPGTISNIRKAIKTIENFSPDLLKEAQLVDDRPLDKIFKLEENEIPGTALGAREKYNEVVNSQLDKTIKTINAIAELERPNAEEITSEEILGIKIVREIFISVLSVRLKEFNDLALPEERDEKSEKEIDLNEINFSTKSNRILAEPEPLEEKNNLEIVESEEKLFKQERGIEISERENKIVFRLGEFPDLSNKREQEVEFNIDLEEKIVSEIIGPDAQEKELQDISPIATGEDKSINTTESAEQKENKLQENIDSYLSFSEKENNTIEEIEREEKLIKSLDVDVDKIIPEKEFSPMSVNQTSWERRKRTVQPWYENLQDGGGLGQRNVSVLGFSVPLPQIVGNSLALFGLTTAEVTRAINSARRTINTGSNSASISFALASAALNRISNNEIKREPYSDFSLQIRDDHKTEKEIKTEGDIVGFNYSNYWTEVDRKGKSEGDEYFNTERDIVNFDSIGYWQRVDRKLKHGDTEKESRLAQFNKIEIKSVPGEGREEYGNFKSRTVEIINGVRGTGFLKIYLLRGPGFENSQAETRIIPFQFEPIISGDSKSADYATISTLARSQAAQVYRRSQERNITLNLEYVVTGTKESNNYKDVKPSKSSEGMMSWDEDYVYSYVVRNLKNLTLPNIVGQGYKLAPPIIQVWYGGFDKDKIDASSTGVVTDPNNDKSNDIHPVFRTNWFTGKGGQKTYRSLWVCKSVGFEYKGGIVNRVSRNTLQVTASLQLTEIAPSVTDNEILVWRKIG